MRTDRSCSGTKHDGETKGKGAPMLENRERSNVFVVHTDPIDARNEAGREGAPGSAASARKETPFPREQPEVHALNTLL